MDGNLKHAWDHLAKTLRALPPSWPRRLVFANPPTIESPPYSRPLNPLRPNDGHCSLDHNDPNNHEFLSIQTLIARDLELYQNFNTQQAKLFITDLHNAADGLEQLKRDHWERGRRTYHSKYQQQHPLETVLSPIAMMLFTPLFLQMKGLSRRLTRFIFQFMCLLVSAVLKLSPEEQQQLAADIPHLPRTTNRLYSILQLDVPHIGYICCPRCYALYDSETWSQVKRPIDSSRRQRLPTPARPVNPHDWLPLNTSYLNLVQSLDTPTALPTPSQPDDATSFCTYRPTPNSKPCGAQLATSESLHGPDEFEDIYEQTYQKFAGAKLQPHLSYYVANLNHWVAELVSRPGMIDILQRVVEPTDSVHDIMQGKGIRELVGPDGQPFIGKHVTGVHLCFALFMDFFNSEGNFIGGKHNSTGGIYLVILNLPVHLRHAPENMFPVFTPGGREPTTDELNNLLRPFVDQLIGIYTDGITIYIQKANKGLKLDVRGMVAIIIADTPAAKKIGGFASHAHRWFCHICRLGREDIESSLSPAQWPRISSEDHDTLAKAWRDAPTTEVQDELFDIYGIRFSELHRIPYLKMTECIGAEPMHAIMQNTIQHHIRKTFGINAVQGDKFYDDDEEEAADDREDQDYAILHEDSPELQKGSAIYNRPGIDTRSLDTLANMQVTTLVTLCERNGVSTWQLPQHKGRPKRIEMVNALVAKMAELWSQPDFAGIDAQEVQDILSSGQDNLVKRNKLRDLSMEILYEACSLAGLDTACLPLQRRSVYPTADAMITSLLDHRGGFDQRISVADVIHRWTQQRHSSNTQSSGAPDASAASANQCLPHFNRSFLQEIWRDIDKAEFPDHLAADCPPKRLGSKQHGRLKASQWRTVCCFTMLITLGRIWGKTNATQQEKTWLTNYLHLVSLVRIAYNYSITQEDIDAFRHHSISYVEGLRSYHPSSIKPSHHFLLHIPDLMQRFGPIRGWWAFPFERFNGQIQHMSKNHKPGIRSSLSIDANSDSGLKGEVEKHFLTQWMRSSRIRVVLSNGQVKALEPVVTLINQELGMQMLSATDLSRTVISPDISEPTSSARLSLETRNALVENGIPLNTPFKILRKVGNHQRKFECYKQSRTNGLVEYRNPAQNTFSVGYIHEMLQFTSVSGLEVTLACVAKCSEVEDQFLQNKAELGVRLCGRNIGSYTLVPIQLLDHVVRYPWNKTSQLIISVHNLRGSEPEDGARNSVFDNIEIDDL